MKLTAFLIAGDTVGVDLLSWDVADLGGSPPFLTEAAVSAGYEEINTPECWDSFGVNSIDENGANAGHRVVKAEIKVLYDADVWANFTDSEKKVFSAWGIASQSERDGVHTAAEQAAHNVEQTLLAADFIRYIIRPGDTDLTATSNDDVVGNFSANGGTTVGFILKVPEGYDVNTNPVMRTYGRVNTAGTSQDYRLQFEAETGIDPYVQDGVSDDTKTWTNSTPDVSDTSLYTDDQELDRVALGLVPGKVILIRWSRLGGDAADTRPGNYRVLHWEIDFRKIPVK